LYYKPVARIDTQKKPPQLTLSKQQTTGDVGFLFAQESSGSDGILFESLLFFKGLDVVAMVAQRMNWTWRVLGAKHDIAMMGALCNVWLR